RGWTRTQSVPRLLHPSHREKYSKKSNQLERIRNCKINPSTSHFTLHLVLAFQHISYIILHSLTLTCLYECNSDRNPKLYFLLRMKSLCPEHWYQYGKKCYRNRDYCSSHDSRLLKIESREELVMSSSSSLTVDTKPGMNTAMGLDFTLNFHAGIDKMTLYSTNALYSWSSSKEDNALNYRRK
uniref:Uncharacterized protein n=1 Tax=Chelonoidis abingdonii TaxID=106734 RepID=A0A8C0G315_CHEAB